MKITQEEFALLYDENISKKCYDEIIEKINKRVDEICAVFLHSTRDNCYNWYAYDNCEDEGVGNFFDPKEYKEDIKLTCEYMAPPIGYDHGNYKQFPTRWLWEDTWQAEMEKTIAEYTEKEIKEKQLKKEQKANSNKQIEILKRSIKAKLTPEEFKVIKFVS